MSVYFCEDEHKLLQAKESQSQARFLKDREYYARSGAHHKGALDFVFWNLPQVLTHLILDLFWELSDSKSILDPVQKPRCSNSDL